MVAGSFHMVAALPRLAPVCWCAIESGVCTVGRKAASVHSCRAVPQNNEMNISLAGKVAIITGAASGIGLAAVKRFLECGAAGVVAVDRHPYPPNEPESRLAIIKADVAQENCAVEFTRVAIDRFGRIDILISNAAVNVIRAIHEHTPEEWETVMNVNVKGLYWAARHVIPVMIGPARRSFPHHRFHFWAGRYPSTRSIRGV